MTEEASLFFTRGAVISPAPPGYTIIAPAPSDDAGAMVQDRPHVRVGGRVSVFDTL